jgi:hypothetical protein
MNRNERRALAHKERKLSSKLARAAEGSHPPVDAVANAPPALEIPEPGGSSHLCLPSLPLSICPRWKRKARTRAAT